MKAPKVLTLETSKDIDEKIVGLLKWYEKKFPEEFSAYREHIKKVRSNLIHDAAMSEGGHFLFKAQIPQKLYYMIPRLWEYSWKSEGKPHEDFPGFWSSIKAKVYHRFFQVAQIFCVNTSSTPKVREDGKGV